jgi:hypothetical protein
MLSAIPLVILKKYRNPCESFFFDVVSQIGSGCVIEKLYIFSHKFATFPSLLELSPYNCPACFPH